MITETRYPNAIYPSPFVAVVTVIKAIIKHITPDYGKKKKIMTVLSFSYLLPQRVPTGLKISVLDLTSKARSIFITRRHQ